MSKVESDVLMKYDVAEAILDQGATLAFEAMQDAAMDDELDDVITWLRRHERDQLLGIAVPPLGELIAALARGEHRR